jgi:hypothetical protein
LQLRKEVELEEKKATYLKAKKNKIALVAKTIVLPRVNLGFISDYKSLV